MLKELEIKDFALIEHIRVSFTAGFNILTGETGAGKSIIIDALNAVLGGKVSSSSIRPGADKATAEAVFLVDSTVSAWLKENELFDDSLDGLVISREITKNGSRARINGTLVNVATLGELRQRLITIHAQHEARTLQSSQSQLEMLDALGDDQHKRLLSRVRTTYARRKDLAGQLSELMISEEEHARRLDFVRLQLTEIEDTSLGEDDEDEKLSAHCRILANVADLETAVSRAQDYLAEGGDEGQSALDLLQSAATELSRAADMDETLSPSLEAINNCIETLQQEARSLRKYSDRLEADPESLQTIQTRLAQLATLKRKYGPTLKEVFQRRDELQEDFDRLENAKENSQTLQKELELVDAELRSLAQDLSSKRRSLAENLAVTIKAELADLGMEHCRFQISLRGSKTETEANAASADIIEIGPSGMDKAEFLIAPNPGQPLMPVAKIASGGELSRVMLAVKSIFAEADSVSTVIFDEIEAGLSGRVLQSMRDKLAKLATSHQILCITHQPIIACIADNHINVTKQQTAEHTRVEVAILDEKERLKAVAGMASGQDGQKEALRFAQSLFADSQRLRADLARGI